MIKKAKEITISSLKELRYLLPAFFIAVLLSTLIELYLPEQALAQILSKGVFIAVPLAALIGVIFPIPRYATYPIAFALLLKGAGYGVIFALISGEVISESIVRDVMEIKFFGIKFFSARLVLSLVFIIAGGLLIEAIL